MLKFFDPEEIKVGDLVRSFYLPIPRVDAPVDIGGDSYVAGIVRGFIEANGYWRYKIQVNGVVQRGEAVASQHEFVYPPINGQQTPVQQLVGGTFDGVVKVSECGRFVPNTHVESIYKNTCRRCKATSAGGVYCPNGCGRM